MRSLFVMQVPQKKEWCGLADPKSKKKVKEDKAEFERLAINEQKMLKKIVSFGKQLRELPGMQISLHTRAQGMEICFGDPANEEPNIAASILRSIKSLNTNLRPLCCQNIVLAGGTCMIPGFKLRVEQEMKHLIESYEEFEELKEIVKLIKLPENPFPNNCLTWVGASMLGGLNNEIDRFICTEEEFKANGEKMPDRFGDAYMFASREENFINVEFEYKN